MSNKFDAKCVFGKFSIRAGIHFEIFGTPGRSVSGRRDANISGRRDAPGRGTHFRRDGGTRVPFSLRDGDAKLPSGRVPLHLC